MKKWIVMLAMLSLLTACAQTPEPESAELTEFSYKSLGTVCSIGNTSAIGVVGTDHEVKGYPASMLKKVIMNKSLMETGGMKEVLSKGRFDLYH